MSKTGTAFTQNSYGVWVEDKELLRTLKKIETKVRTDILVEATKEAAAAITKEVRRRAPRGTEDRRSRKLHREIKHELGGKRNGKVVWRIHTGKAYWGLFVEYGTRARAALAFRKKGGGRGRYKDRQARRSSPARPAQPFMRPALAARADAALDVSSRVMRREIERVR